MMTPFLYLLPALGNYCDCQGMADCGCCLGFLINPVGLQNNGMYLERTNFQRKMSFLKTWFIFSLFQYVTD